MAIANYKKGEMAASRDGYGDALLELGEKHKEIVALDADLAKSTKSIVFGKKFPDRFRYIGISEADMVSMAAGLARSGKVPFVSSFASFLVNRAFDQIKISVSYSQTNVKIVGSHGGILTGQDGPTGQSVMDLAVMRSVPHFSVFVPADYFETIACTNAMYENIGPMFMRTCREKTEIVFDSVPEFKPGKATVMLEGSDASILACGPMVSEGLKAAQILKGKGILASVLDFASIKPIDESALRKEASKGVIVTAEDGLINGLGGAVAESCAEMGLSPRIGFIGLRNSFAESGKGFELLKKYKMDSNAIAGKVEEILNASKR